MALDWRPLFRFHRSRQGGTDVPWCWRAITEYLVRPLHERWVKRGLCIQLVPEGEQLTPLVWADNIWLLARDLDTAKLMTLELARRLSLLKLQWKRSSLHYLRSPAYPGLNV